MLYMPFGGGDGITLIRRVVDLLQEGRRMLDQSNSATSEDKVANSINAAYAEMSHAAQKAGASQLLRFFNATIYDTDTGELDFLWNHLRGVLVTVTRRNGSDDTEPTTDEWQAVQRHVYDSPNGYGGGAGGFLLTGDGKFRMQRGSTSHWRIWWMRQPPPLHYGTTTVGGDDDTLFFTSTPTAGELIPQIDDFYNDTIVQGISGSMAGEFVRVSAYNASDFEATCVSLTTPGAIPFPSNPEIGDVYSLLPWFDAKWQELLCKMASTYFFKQNPDPKLDFWIEQQMNLFRASLIREDMTTPLRIQDRGNVNTGLESDRYRRGSSGYGYWGG